MRGVLRLPAWSMAVLAEGILRRPALWDLIDSEFACGSGKVTRGCSRWDPSLLLVLGGAVVVTVIAFRFILRRSRPLLESRFSLPATGEIDGPLVVGAILFGIGWGISSYCPGSAIASLAAPNRETWIFLPAIFLGALLLRLTTFSPENTARTRATETGSSA